MYSSTPFRRSSSTTITSRASGRGARVPLPETRGVEPAARPGGRAGLRAPCPSFRPLPAPPPLTVTERTIAFHRIVGAALALLLGGTTPALGVETEIERSPADTRSYRAVTLDNGLEALVVSDPSADKAAAALDLNAGSADDPHARPGMAHFLEHMLFLGTEKYPDPGEYNRFITEHGGFSNASTSFAHTSYFFEVDAPHLEGALDRFAQFFITPRFDPEYLAGERRIVHSEYVSRSRSDHVRSLAAWKQALDPRHPLARFHVGTAATLAERPGAEVRDELIAFYDRTYSAHRMKLVVLGREPLDDLERFVRTRFEVVKRRPAERLRIAAPLFRAGLLPARLAIEPIRETRTLSLSFAIPPLRPHYRAKPVALISHLVGHEGGGSLLSALKERGWAEGLSAGPGVSHPDFATFGITVRATEAGVANADEVVALVFAYLDLVRADGLAPRYRDELARMAELEFRFMDKAPALDHALALAAALHLYPVGEVLAAPYRYDEADPALERRFLAALTPDRVLVTVIARGVATDSVSPFFEVPFRLSAIPPQTLARWRSPAPAGLLSLPEPNPFVPGALALIEAGAGAGAGEPHPVRIVERPGFELWHRADVEFGQPRANFYFTVRSPIANDTPRHAVLSSLHTRLVEDALTEFSYPAAIAGHTYLLYRHHRGITVGLSGWSDKQGEVLTRIVSTLRAPPVSPSRFEAEREEYARLLRNLDERPPNRRAMSEVGELLLAPEWSTGALLAALDEVTPGELREYVANVFARGRIVALAHGNLTAQAARALGEVLERELLAAMQPVAVARGKVARLDPGARFARWLESSHEDHAVVLYRQGHRQHVHERAKLALMAQTLRNRFFQELRTERKIGYIVFATPLTLRRVPGLAMVLQSDTTPPERLVEELDAFLTRFDSVLRAMSSEEFERHRRAVENELLEADTQLDERTAWYWAEIGRERYGFDSRERFLAAVRAIDREALVAAWREVVLAPETARGVLVAVSPGKPPDAGPLLLGARPIADAGEFRRGLQYFDEK